MTGGPQISRCIVFDIETTGLNPRRGHRIIEIGAVAIEEGGVKEEFHSLIRTERSIPKDARKLHRITKEMLSGQPGAEEVLSAFRRFIGESVLVAHNADFDMGFLRSEGNRIGWRVTNRCLCTLKLSREYYPGLTDYRLETVAKHVLGVEIDERVRHRALDDARLTAEIWMRMRRI